MNSKTEICIVELQQEEEEEEEGCQGVRGRSTRCPLRTTRCPLSTVVVYPSHGDALGSSNDRSEVSLLFACDININSRCELTSCAGSHLLSIRPVFLRVIVFEGFLH